MNAKTTSVRFSQRFLRFIGSFSESKSNSSLIRDLVESMSDNELALRANLSEAIQESTQSKLSRLSRILDQDYSKINFNDVGFVLICCHRAYLSSVDLTLKKSTYQKNIVSVVRELIPLLKASSKIDINQIYLDLGFVAGKGIDEQFDALNHLPDYCSELGDMRFLCSVTDNIHLLSATDKVSNGLADRLKFLIPVAVLGILSDACVSDRVSAIGSKLFSPNARVVLNMHEYINKPANSVLVLSDGRELQISVGSSGLLQTVVRSSDARFEMTFTPIASIELFDLASSYDMNNGVFKPLSGRDLSLSLIKDGLMLKVCNVSLFITLDDTLLLVGFIKNLQNLKTFNEYVTYSKRTLGDL